MAPNFPLCIKNTQEHENIRVKRKKANNQNYAFFKKTMGILEN
jgi:hypothetical protein